MSLENRKKTGLGKKIDSHEFDFNPDAWDKMESMLDDQNPPEARRIVPYFFTFKMIAAMLFLIVLAFFLLPINRLPVAELPVAELVKPVDPKRDNSGDAAKDKFDTKNRSSSRAENESMKTTISEMVENSSEKKTFKKQKIITPGASKTPTPKAKQAVPIELPASVVLRGGITNPQFYPPIHPPLLIPETDSTFLPKLEEKLAARLAHFLPEKVYLQFDKPFFKPGETVWFNAFVRDANTLSASEKSDFLYVELLKPNGGILKKIKVKAENGIAAGDFLIPQSANGGVYKIKAYTNWQRNEDSFFEREITVQKNVLPNLRIQLDFMKKSYGAGDEVIANLELKTLANEFLKSHNFEAKIALDGNDFITVKGKTDERGQSKINFRLPQKLERNEGMLNVMISYNGQTESIARPIPILLKKIDLQFFPEGGDLIAGFSTKIAFKAIDEFGKPADIEGEVVGESGIIYTKFKSFHDGMGSFQFQPQKEKYSVRITKPKGITETYRLPETQKRGFGLSVENHTDDSLVVVLNSTENEYVTAVVRSADKIQFSKTVPLINYSKKINQGVLKIPTKNLPVGIAQITLFDSKNIPRAERLVFVNVDKELNIKINTDKEKYLPREKISMSVEVTDERGLGVPGHFSLAVADDKLLSYADDKQGHILSSLLLESELKGKIHEPNFYFEKDEKEPAKSRALALDYLMLTHGWRRFDWESILMEPKFAEVKFQGEKAEISGQVLDENREPVADADVRLPGLNLNTKTDKSGHFVFDNPPFLPLQYQIQVHKDKNINYNTFSGYKQDLKLYFGDGRKPVFSPGNGYVTGKLLDEGTGEPLLFANVILKKNGKLVQGTQTDFDGIYAFQNIPAGSYNLTATYTGYENHEISNMVVYAEKQNTLDIVMGYDNLSLDEVVVTAMGVQRKKNSKSRKRKRKKNKGNTLNEVVVTEYKVPLIEQDNTTSGATLTSEQLKKLPTRNIAAIAANAAGLNEEKSKNKVSGSREGPTFYYVDGLRVKRNQSADEAAKEEELPVAADLISRPTINADECANCPFGSNSKDRRGKKLKYNPGNSIGGIYIPREFYTPKYESKKVPEIRQDFRETIYWNPSITTDRNGKAQFEFYASDAITTFQATLEGIGIDGKIGRGTQTFFTQLPFGMSVKMPANLIEGDLINVPISVSNHTDEKVSGELTITYPAGFETVGDLPSKIEIKAGEQQTIFVPFLIKNNTKRQGLLKVQFKANGLQDAFIQEVKTSPRGFPVSEVFSGNELEKTFELNVVNPVGGSIQAEFAAHPSPISDLISGLDRMLRQPNGCFEQTSSSNYPNLLAINYLRESGEHQPEIEKRGKDFLKKGYNRLKTFEVNGGGFDWYGRAPAHEGLTAYGLMQFQDMKSVHRVEQDLIDRTAKWLLSRRNGKGGWKKKQHGAHRWLMSDEISDGYISWALSEAGFGEKIEKEIEKSLNDALFSEDAYLLALMANTMLNSKDKRSKDLINHLLEFQAEDGSWSGNTTSIVGSRGKNLTVETTGLATLALMKTGERSVALEKAIDYLAAAKTNYGFGSTQATVLAMKALVKYAVFSKKMSDNGMIALYLNDDKIAEEKYEAGQTQPVIFTGLEKYIRTGEQNFKVKFSKTKTALPYELSLKYSTVQPLNAADCRVNLTTDLRKAKATQGDNIRFDISVKNITSEGLPNTIAVIGIPSGMSTQPKQLKKLSDEGVFDFYEILPTGYIAFHFRSMAPNEIKQIPLELKADLTGEFESPASVAYLYYENDLQFWSKPEKVVVSD